MKQFDIEEWGHRLIIERIEKYLEKVNKNNKTDQYGLMIEDTVSPKNDEMIRNKVHIIMADGTMYSKINYLIEDPLFTVSKWRNLSQLVDCVAYCIRRKFKCNQSLDKKRDGIIILKSFQQNLIQKMEIISDMDQKYSRIGKRGYLPIPIHCWPYGHLSHLDKLLTLI